MKKAILSLLGVILSLVIVVSCDPEKEEENEEIVVTEPQIDDTNIYGVQTFDTVIVLEKRIVKRLKKKLPAFDKSKFNEVTVDFFFRLAEGTNGEAYFAESSSKVKDVVVDILKTHVKSGTDVLFLIDKTGSMKDDIRKTRQSVDLFIEILSSMDNVRVGMAFYGDKNVDHVWYDKFELSENYGGLKQILNDIEVTGGGDTPESVNDGIYKSVKEYNWDTRNNKMILVLGDAPSLKPPYSDHSEEQVVQLCSKQGIKVNLYPVIIGLGFSDEKVETPVEESVEKTSVESTEIIESTPMDSFEIKVYPNPVSRSCAIEMDEWSKYEISVYDMMGHKVISKIVDDYQARLDFGRQSNGYYLIKVLDKDNNRMCDYKIVVQH